MSRRSRVPWKNAEEYANGLLAGSNGSLFLRNDLVMLSVGFVLRLSKPPRSVSLKPKAKREGFSIKSTYPAVGHQRKSINQRPLGGKVLRFSSTFRHMSSWPQKRKKDERLLCMDLTGIKFIAICNHFTSLVYRVRSQCQKPKQQTNTRVDFVVIC